MSKILLLGGTGALGTYVTQHLLKRDKNLSISVTSRAKHSDSSGVKYIHGNAKDPGFLNELLSTEKYDCIVDFMIWKTAEFKAVHKQLLNSCGQYIFTSSYRAYANAGVNKLNENSPLLVDVIKDKEYLATDEYALCKGRSEKILHGCGLNNYTIIRPSITFSRNRFQIGTLEAPIILPRSLRGEPLLFPKEMLHKKAAISWAGDVGYMIASLIGNEKAYRETFNVSSSSNYDWEQVANLYNRFLGTTLALTDVETYINAVGGKYQTLYDRMYDRVMDNSKVLSFIGMEEKQLTPIPIALEQELKDTLINNGGFVEDVRKNDAMNVAIKEAGEALTNVLSSNPKSKDTFLANCASSVNKSVGILNFHFANNYGAVLVPFAMVKVINDLGYDPVIINYVAKKFMRHPAFVSFRGKHLGKITREFNDIASLKDSKLKINRFVVGSDQVWRMFDTNVYLLSWVSGLTNFISYAASFGHDKYEGSISRARACALLKRFDAISVREESGVDVCLNEFGAKAIQVLDPTLLVERKVYEDLIAENENRVPDEQYICGIFLNAKSQGYFNNRNVLFSLRNKYKLINPIKDEKNQYRPVSEWLALIKNAKYVITDSFHGAVFSIIFNKQFVTLMHEGFNGNARIPSLLNAAGISQNRIYTSIDEITVESFKELIDYKYVKEKLSRERERSIDFLKESLSKPLSYKTELLEPDILSLIKDRDNFFPTEDVFINKWFKCKLIDEFSTPSNQAVIGSNNAKPKYTLSQFLIYYMYRGLFRVTSGKLQCFFKKKRAEYRQLVRGDIP